MVSQEEKNKYINTYVWNLGKWYRRTYLQGRNRDADVQDRRLDMMKERVQRIRKSAGGGGLVTKLCPTLCNPMDCSLPGSSVHGISQVRILE